MVGDIYIVKNVSFDVMGVCDNTIRKNQLCSKVKVRSYIARYPVHRTAQSALHFMWGDQTCQRFEATAVGFETGFSRLRVRPSNRYAIVPHVLTHLPTGHRLFSM